jgi:PKD repeat protein
MLRSNVLARIVSFIFLILMASTTNTDAQIYPIADFYSNVTSGDAPLTVAFTDVNTGISNSWIWTFGDGYASDIRNPTHTYSTAGTYTVKLTVKNNLDVTNTNIKTNYITVNGATNAPFAHFTSNNTYGSAPLSVSFTDTSSGSPTRWLWEFGDGAVCPDQNPV